MEAGLKVYKEEWYEALVEECKAIVTEAQFTSRWALVEGYWNLGKRIREENDNFERAKIYGEKIVQGLAISLGISTRTIHYALQFYDKYPKLDRVPEGKNISWNKLITKYLPEPKTKEVKIPQECAKGNKTFVQDLARNLNIGDRTILLRLFLLQDGL